MAFSIALIPVLLAFGIAIDFTRASNARSHMKHASSAAVLAAVGLENGTDQEKVDLAEKVFGANFVVNGVGTPTVSVLVSGDTASVGSSLPVPTSFLGLAGIDLVDVSVSSGALHIKGHTVCLLALHPTAEDAISLVGTADLVANDCAVHANSDHSSALHTQGSTSAVAEHFCAIGGSTGNNFSPSPQSNCKEVKDPYEGLAAPAYSGCDYHNKQFKKGNFIANPGVYCGGLSLKTHAAVVFSSGIYVIKDGPFTVDAQSTAVNVGDGVFFYFTGDDTRINIQSGADVELRALPDGPYAGLIFAQDPASNPGAESNIQGGGSIKLVGTGYLPTQSISIGGNGSVGSTSLAWSVIASTIRLHGNAFIELSIDHEAAGLPPMLPTVGNSTRLTN